MFGFGLDLATVEATKLADLVNGQGSGSVGWVEVGQLVGLVGLAVGRLGGSC